MNSCYNCAYQDRSGCSLTFLPAFDQPLCHNWKSRAKKQSEAASQMRAFTSHDQETRRFQVSEITPDGKYLPLDPSKPMPKK